MLMILILLSVLLFYYFTVVLFINLRFHYLLLYYGACIVIGPFPACSSHPARCCTQAAAATRRRWLDIWAPVVVMYMPLHVYFAAVACTCLLVPPTLAISGWAALHVLRVCLTAPRRPESTGRWCCGWADLGWCSLAACGHACCLCAVKEHVCPSIGVSINTQTQAVSNTQLDNIMATPRCMRQPCVPLLADSAPGALSAGLVW